MSVRACRIRPYMAVQCLFRGGRGIALRIHTESVLCVCTYIRRHPAPRGGGGMVKQEEESDRITTEINLWKGQLAIPPRSSAQDERRTCLLFLPR